ncbi:hypothetical protein RDWZM_007255 [Blomia tropicalis]|uniref:Uncharacterized protein n=1 Tax=Blomia tropicalis TaxID=40697 RepID=A0A9Q0MA01_BLOTA|nr:hypothetical protein RDWZM_007255 [Blomia tropicalis]
MTTSLCSSRHRMMMMKKKKKLVGKSPTKSKQRFGLRLFINPSLYEKHNDTLVGHDQ